MVDRCRGGASQNETTQSVDWSDPSNNGGTVTIAKAQEGDAPVQPKDAKYGDLIAQIYIPRFGSQWHRNIVEGTTLEQLNRHGLGHYDTTQMPGQVGNFAVAGHRNGYGQPLGDVDKLQEGDPIIVRTKDYWYVYHYTRYEIVLPTDVHVIAPNPEDSTANPTKRMITLTTCEPKYSTPTHRWISYGELAYWAKVSDGVPKELATTDSSGAVMFSTTETPSIASRIGSLDKVVFGALVVWLVLFIAAAVAWRWPVLREIRAGERRRPDAKHSMADCCVCSPAWHRFDGCCWLCCCSQRRGAVPVGIPLGRRQYPIPTADVELRGSELTAS